MILFAVGLTCLNQPSLRRGCCRGQLEPFLKVQEALII
jgi:hypothetical protein